MGLYNLIWVELECPRCQSTLEQSVEVVLGYCWLFEYRMGDKIQWVDGLVDVCEGARPLDGNCYAEGYCECENCRKDFYVLVEVRNDLLVSAKPNLERRGMIE